jgi:transcriptional regulator with XRE-family HTH domain
MDLESHSLRQLLRQARTAARLSQLALSLRLGVSQRHISFVESGRAQPSRALLHTWLAELQVPLAVRNLALEAAGYAPTYTAARLGDAELAMAETALLQLLRSHDPMPAWVIDADWNVLQANCGARWLVETLATTSAPPQGASLNMLDLLLAPDGLLARIVNLPEVGPAMLSHLRADASAHPALAPKVDALSAAVRARLGAATPLAPVARRLTPVLPTRFATPYGVLSFFTMLTTFGTPQDITLASLRVEHMFAADVATAEVLQAQVPRRNAHT